MDKNLLGYLLNCLDDTEQREVEARLATDPESRDRLDKLRQALAPLEADRDNAEPPHDLVYRTLARVAEYCSQALPRAPVTRASGGAERPFWRRADVVAAAAVVLLAVGIGAPALYRMQVQSASLVECQNNLREFYNGLSAYHDHKGQFPNVTAEAPHNVAGMVVPMLVSAGSLPENVSVRCPANGPGRPCPFTLEQIKAMTPEEFQKHAASLASCYAYSLGYRDAAGYHPPTRSGTKASLYPIMSDRPPYDDGADNSPNHGKKGQNVLFQDGTVKFLNDRSLPFDSDIFKSRSGKVAAGDDEDDAVLGHSASRP